MDTTQIIAGFHGPHAYLSNFAASPIRDEEGIEYPTAEHFFQAQKTTDRAQREAIAAKPKPGQAKHAGKRVTLRDGWNQGVRIEAMQAAIAAKFAPGTAMAEALDATGDATLQEVNTWNDTFWGISKKTGKGQNTLGNILMAQRAANRRA